MPCYRTERHQRLEAQLVIRRPSITAIGWCVQPGAKAGITATLSRKATHPITRSDVDGQPLDGGNANYTLTFAEAQYPRRCCQT